ncbi:MAG: class I SAM-dependent methyltransferase [Acidobacteria bacterium]|nr:class I SAM-dependent methyltransferase [Acidobacteriota bacterium]
MRTSYRQSFFLLLALSLAATLTAQPPGRPGGKGRRGAVLTNQPQARNDAEKRILTTMEGIVASHNNYLSVPVSDGMALRLLAEAAGAKNIVEVGTSTGYSGLWLCLALRSTGGHLTTFELDHGRATMAAGHFKEAGVDKLVTIIEGDAHANVTKLKGPIDLVFIDADKEGYLDYLTKLLPLVRPGGLILAHNIDSATDYVQAVSRNPELETIFYMQGGGLGVTVKKR